MFREDRYVFGRSAEQDEAPNSQLECLIDGGALPLVAVGRIPANCRKEKLRDFTHAGVRLPRTRGPRAPVAEGTLPGRFVTCRYPSNAKATASLASPSKYTSSKWRTATGAAAF